MCCVWWGTTLFCLEAELSSSHGTASTTTEKYQKERSNLQLIPKNNRLLNDLKFSYISNYIRKIYPIFETFIADPRHSWKCQSNRSTTRPRSRRTNLRGNLEIVHFSRVSTQQIPLHHSGRQLKTWCPKCSIVYFILCRRITNTTQRTYIDGFFVCMVFSAILAAFQPFNGGIHTVNGFAFCRRQADIAIPFAKCNYSF